MSFWWDRLGWGFFGDFLCNVFYEAVEIDPTYQRAWTLMADIYHRIGIDRTAPEQCLIKSYGLAELGL